MAASEDEKLPTLTMDYLKDYLQRNSSPKKKLSFKEIHMGISMELTFGDPNDHKVYVSTSADDSTGKQLKRLLESYGTKSHPYLKNSAGVHIFCTDKIWEQKDGKKRVLPDPNNKVFYAESALNEESVNILRDSLEVFPYAEPSVTADIISRLNRLTPEYNRTDYDPNRVSAVKYPGTYYENVREIMKALSGITYDPEGKTEVLDKEEREMLKSEQEKKRSKKIKKISFKYYAYNEKKELELRISSEGKEIRTVNPVKLMWSNGYYYLVSFTVRDNAEEKDRYRFVNYRVDRMKEVKCSDEDAVRLENFSPDKYRSRHPIMYSDDSVERVEIKCKKSLINNAIDTFGFDIRIEPASENDTVIIKIKDTSATGVKMWALEYGFGCEITYPPYLREEMKKAALDILKKYG